MSISETITKNDLTNILNEVLLSPNYGGIYKASWTASSSSANGTQLTADLIIPAGTYVINCISPVASVDFSLAIAGRYKEMNKSGDSFTIIYSCDEEVTFHVSSAQSAAVTFSYTDRGSLTAIQISQQSVASNVTDYIVEEGTSNGWSYRKWNSGFAECWYFSFLKESVAFAAWGGLYYADVATGLNFPFTWSAAPIVYLTPYDSQAGVFGNWNVTTTGVGTIRFIHNTNNSTTVRCHIYATGRWK